MKKYIFSKYLVVSLILGVTLASCGKDDDDDPAPTVPNEEEVITTLRYTLTPDTGDVVVFSFQDLDGDQGDPPTITVSDLIPNTIYTGSIELLNETETPAEDVTEEIEEEDEEHQFFFEVSNSSIATVAYGDQDSDGNPVGLSSTLTTTDAGTGTLKITLRHEPDKSAANVSDGDITNAGGETDIEVTFDLVVQ